MFGVSHARGERSAMEDRHTVVKDFDLHVRQMARRNFENRAKTEHGGNLNVNSILDNPWGRQAYGAVFDGE